MIRLKNISKSFYKKNIFNQFNLEIEDQRFAVIHGKSGSGKSTLLNIIGLIDTFEEGDLEIFSKVNPNPNGKEAMLLRRKSISYLFQNYALIENETIANNLKIAQEYQTITKREKSYKQKEILERMGMNYPLSEKIYMLSGGEKQRVALARAILKENKLILADEPTGSLDTENRDIIIELLKEQQEKGKTVIIASHDPYIIELAEQRIDLDKITSG